MKLAPKVKDYQNLYDDDPYIVTEDLFLGAELQSEWMIEQIKKHFDMDGEYGCNCLGCSEFAHEGRCNAQELIDSFKEEEKK